ncbi:hypothetical protein AUJ16_04020 [Candidatus Micrarchaeota archaeon CG1_02_60_51]|nr:MAG: hypothetical protein AUJ16_04020 [Candidatus Micrarchaeota archaeon CG1_02_60_51]
MIAATGSIGLDTTRTPFKTVERVLGGSASYFSYCASFFDKVGLVSVVGGDFPEKYWRELEAKGVDLKGVQRNKGKTFHFDSSFSYDLYARTANATEFGVLASFEPRVPDEYKDAKTVYAGTNNPKIQLEFLRQFGKQKVSFIDTIEHFIANDRAALLRVLSEADGFVLNDVEARMLCDTPNLVKAGKKIHSLGPEIVVIKKGEHGCLVFYGGGVCAFPAFPLEEVLDPTGAGDSFAGGFVGSLARDGKISWAGLKRAAVLGSVMGSFACEGYGLDRLRKLDERQIDERFEFYREMTSL